MTLFVGKRTPDNMEKAKNVCVKGQKMFVNTISREFIEVFVKPDDMVVLFDRGFCSKLPTESKFSLIIID